MHVEEGGDGVLTCCGVGCGIEGYSRHDQQAVRWCSWLSRSPHTRKVLSSSLSRISRFFLLLAPSDFDGMGAFGLFFCRGLYFCSKCEVRCHILGGSEMINAVNRSVSHLTSTFCRSRWLASGKAGDASLLCRVREAYVHVENGTYLQLDPESKFLVQLLLA